MIFVTADSCRAQLERLTQILVSSFPGSTIYRHTELGHVPHDVLNHKVDTVVLEAEMEHGGGLELVRKLHRQKAELTVFLVSRTGDSRRAAEEAGANGYFVLPEEETLLLDAIRSGKNRGNDAAGDRNPIRC